MKNFVLLDSAVISTISRALGYMSSDLQFAAITNKDNSTMVEQMSKEHAAVYAAQEAVLAAIVAGNVIKENEELKAKIDDLEIQLADAQISKDL